MEALPTRVRTLVIGGGIHGAGLLHDLASRGWTDIALIERSRLSCGTSARSTKLIHGGLRYLRNLRDFPLVTEALKERKVLESVAPDLIKPIELFLPVLKSGGMPSFVLRTGLGLYDFLAGSRNIHPHRVVRSSQEIQDQIPLLDRDKVSKVLSFWDMQTDDAALVYRVSGSAQKLGAKVYEHCEAVRVTPSPDGWDVTIKDKKGELKTISALYVFNAMGPWAHDLFDRSDLKPKFHGVNSKGAHLILGDLGQKVGMFLQSPDDDRIFFILPWEGKTLIGTTEEGFSAHPDELTVTDKDVKYLLERCNRYLKQPLREQQIESVFAGLRWLQSDERRELGATTRAYAVSEHKSGRGVLFTLYGGKYTTYRNLAKTIGDRIVNYFGEIKPSATDNPRMWLPVGSKHLQGEHSILDRFSTTGLGFTPRV